MPGTRRCDRCGRSYEFKRASSKFCSSSCRTQASKPTAGVVALPAGPAPVETETVEATRAHLARLGRLEHPLGLMALRLAQRLDGATADTGSSLAAVTKELRAVLTEAAAGVKVSDDPVDELRRQREKRRGA